MSYKNLSNTGKTKSIQDQEPWRPIHYLGSKLRILENNNKDLVAARLFLIKKIFFVIKSGLNILNVSIVKEM